MRDGRCRLREAAVADDDEWARLTGGMVLLPLWLLLVPMLVLPSREASDAIVVSESGVVAAMTSSPLRTFPWMSSSTPPHPHLYRLVVVVPCHVGDAPARGVAQHLALLRARWMLPWVLDHQQRRVSLAVSLTVRPPARRRPADHARRAQHHLVDHKALCQPGPLNLDEPPAVRCGGDGGIEAGLLLTYPQEAKHHGH